jgi:hypothetical protein
MGGEQKIAQRNSRRFSRTALMLATAVDSAYPPKRIKMPFVTVNSSA